MTEVVLDEKRKLRLIQLISLLKTSLYKKGGDVMVRVISRVGIIQKDLSAEVKLGRVELMFIAESDEGKYIEYVLYDFKSIGFLSSTRDRKAPRFFSNYERLIAFIRQRLFYKGEIIIRSIDL